MKREIEQISVVIFWNQAQGPQAALANHPTLKHCNFINFDGDATTLMDFDQTGFVLSGVKSKSIQLLIKGLKKNHKVEAVVALGIYKRFKKPWRPFLVRSCNEIVRYGIGVETGFTLNPVHFYVKLLKYRHSRNYEILSHWRRKDGISRRRGRREQRCDQRNQSTD